MMNKGEEAFSKCDFKVYYKGDDFPLRREICGMRMKQQAQCDSVIWWQTLRYHPSFLMPKPFPLSIVSAA
ncbi:hypothetical protein Y1Q_0004020 [Alligator mississippiensis]|uniref:Uncharacterized protein n=1 Tax=Alligator mississippiensis TaxID=8496 RepID=A0A151PI32_ALLMI|nr:hypothetical protein Y1Q_0004020 [Alligator mississippiensis]